MRNSKKILVGNPKSKRDHFGHLDLDGDNINMDQFPAGAMMEHFTFATASRPALGPTQPPIQWVPGALSHGLKRPWREADHSRPSSAEVKNAWSYTTTLPIHLYGAVLS
jgi:hypothetical protein